MVILDAERDVRTPVGAVWRALVDYPRYPRAARQLLAGQR